MRKKVEKTASEPGKAFEGHGLDDLRRQAQGPTREVRVMIANSGLELEEQATASHAPGYAAAVQAGDARRAQLFAPMLSSADFAKAKGVSRETVIKWRKEQRILGLQNGTRVFRYPDWQAVDGVFERLPPVLEALREVEPWAAFLFLTRPHPLLDDRTPVDCILSGDLGPVVSVAHSYAEEAA